MRRLAQVVDAVALAALVCAVDVAVCGPSCRLAGRRGARAPRRAVRSAYLTSLRAAAVYASARSRVKFTWAAANVVSQSTGLALSRFPWSSALFSTSFV